MRKLGFALFTLAVLAASAFAAEDARVLILKAQASAAREDKEVLVIFGAL